jgi:hypothetical protein
MFFNYRCDQISAFLSGAIWQSHFLRLSDDYDKKFLFDFMPYFSQKLGVCHSMFRVLEDKYINRADAFDYYVSEIMSCLEKGDKTKRTKMIPQGETNYNIFWWIEHIKGRPGMFCNYRCEISAFLSGAMWQRHFLGLSDDYDEKFLFDFMPYFSQKLGISPDVFEVLDDIYINRVDAFDYYVSEIMSFLQEGDKKS